MTYLNTNEDDIEFTYAVRKSAFHLAGIIPVHGQQLDFGMDWHPSLSQIAPDFTAIENSVAECIYAGCETIWIVVNEDATPLIRHRIGEIALDPVTAERARTDYEKMKNRLIPIKYVPTLPMNIERRDSLSYSALRGCYVASKVAGKLSKWVIPDRFYVSFPYGIFDYKELRKHRKIISGKYPFVVRHEGETFKDGLHLSFTMNHGDWKACKKDVQMKEKGKRDMEDDGEKNRYGLPKKRLPKSESYTARFYSPADVFETVSEEKARYCDLTWFHDISSWNKYRDYLSSEHEAERPKHNYLRYREWNPIGVDITEDN